MWLHTKRERMRPNGHFPLKRKTTSTKIDADSSEENDHAELIEHLDHCRDLLDLLKDPSARKPVTDLIAYLERTLAAMDGVYL